MQTRVIILVFCVLVAVLATRHPVADRTNAPRGWASIGKADDADTISFSILLKQRNLDALDTLFERVSNPQSPQYGKFWTPQQINDLVKPSKATFSLIKSWLQAFELLEVEYKGDYIKIKTTVAEASKMFGCEFHYFYNEIYDKLVLRADGVVTVPAYLKQHIDFVAGISEFFVQDVEKTFKANTAFLRMRATPSKGKRAVPSDPIVTPSLLKSYYGVPASLVGSNSKNLHGIAAFTDYFSTGALSTFDASQNLTTPSVTRIGPDCFPNCDQYESDLDVQYITGMGQGIPLIFLNQPSNYWILQFAQDALEMTPQPLVWSVSYGWSELAQCDIATYVCGVLGYNSTQYVNRTNTELQKLGSSGVSVLVSDGDDGAPNLGEATGNCPLDITHWCPVGGCVHSSSKCGSFQVTNLTTGDICDFPMGSGNDACSVTLNDQNFDTALGAYFQSLPQCNLAIEQDSEGNPHFYSSCVCTQLSVFTMNGYAIGPFQFRPSVAVFTADYPTSSPYVTSVGATQFIPSPNGTMYEVSCSILTGAIITTGGGFSSFQKMPSYQSAVVSSYVSTVLSKTLPKWAYNAQMRAYPDVAFNGHHYYIYYSNNTSDQCPCLATEVDGTSCSSPALAGMISLINDKLLNSGKSQLGFLNYLLYEMYSADSQAFNDIQLGNNACNRAYCCMFGYTASVGWDAVSGLGTPVFERMLDYILDTKKIAH